MSETTEDTAAPPSVESLQAQLAEFTAWRDGLTTRAHRLADNSGMCRTFDHAARELGLPGRPRDYSILVVRGVRVTTTSAQYVHANVRAGSEDEAREIVAQRLSEPDPWVGLIGRADPRWSNAPTGQDSAYYVPELATRPARTAVLVEPRVWTDQTTGHGIDPDDDGEDEQFDDDDD